jgi:hypothetical protein
MSDSHDPPIVEPFVTLANVAKQLGLPLFKIRRAARAGLFPVYVFGNGRILTRTSEVVAAIERSRAGVSDE